MGKRTSEMELMPTPPAYTFVAHSRCRNQAGKPTSVCGGMRPHMDLTSGVHLLVADQDRDQSLALLCDSVEKIVSSPWACPACGEEIKAGFDTYWKCGAAKV